MKLFGVGPRRLGPPDPIRNAEVRILPPQPASPVSTGQPAKALKTTRYRGISRIRLGLRVRIWATEASIWPLVSEATFWCLVFAEPITSMMSGARYGNRRPGRVDARHAANRCRARGCVGGLAPPSSPFNSILERVVRCWHSNAYSSLFSSLFFFDFHRTNFSRFFDPVGFAIFANLAPTP